MDGIGIGDFRRRNDVGDVEVTLDALCWSDTDGFICETHMKAFSVSSGIHCNGLDAHFLAGADDPKGNLTAVGDQDFLEHVENRWAWPLGSGGFHEEKRLVVFDRAVVVNQDLNDSARNFAFDFVEELHGFNDTNRISGLDG